MSTEEQVCIIGQAFLDRKAALQTLKCLKLKLGKMRQALDFVLQASADLGRFQNIEVDGLADYPSQDDVLAIASEIRSVQQEIDRLDKELD